MTDRSDGLEAHPDLAATGARMREAWRAEQEAATKDAAEAWMHRQTLQDRLRAHMHRGDRIAISIGGQRIVGIPEEIGADLLALRNLGRRVDIHLAANAPMWYEVVDKATEGGHRGSDAAAGRFVNVLYAREQEPRVTVGTVFDADGLDGKLVVGADHVAIIARAGKETIVPLSQVTWIAPTAL